MAAINGFFGSLQGPFQANEELFTKIQMDCKNTIRYISKIGIHYIGNTDLDIQGLRNEQVFVRINGINFQIGKTRMLELEDVQITSIQFTQNVNDSFFIDYQYV